MQIIFDLVKKIGHPISAPLAGTLQLWLPGCRPPRDNHAANALDLHDTLDYVQVPWKLLVPPSPRAVTRAQTRTWQHQFLQRLPKFPSSPRPPPSFCPPRPHCTFLSASLPPFLIPTPQHPYMPLSSPSKAAWPRTPPRTPSPPPARSNASLPSRIVLSISPRTQPTCCQCEHLHSTSV